MSQGIEEGEGVKAGTKLDKKELARVYKRLVKGGVISRIPRKVVDAADLVTTWAKTHGWEFQGLTDRQLVWKLRTDILNLKQVIATNAEIASGKKEESASWIDV